MLQTMHAVLLSLVGAPTLRMYNAGLQKVYSNSQSFATLGKKQRACVDEGAHFVLSGSKKRRVFEVQERK